MAQSENEIILKELQRIIETQDILRDYVSDLKERMSSLEMMLGTQMVQNGQMHLRINQLEEMVRHSKHSGRGPDPLPELH